MKVYLKTYLFDFKEISYKTRIERSLIISSLYKLGNCNLRLYILSKDFILHKKPFIFKSMLFVLYDSIPIEIVGIYGLRLGNKSRLT